MAAAHYFDFPIAIVFAVRWGVTFHHAGGVARPLSMAFGPASATSDQLAVLSVNLASFPAACILRWVSPCAVWLAKRTALISELGTRLLMVYGIGALRRQLQRQPVPPLSLD